MHPDELESLFAEAANAGRDSIRFSLFSPELLSTPRFRAVAEAREETPVRTGAPVPCTRWRVDTPVSPGLTSLEWRDDRGVLRQIEYPAMQLRATACPTEEARAIVGGAELMMATLLATTFEFESQALYHAIDYLVRYPVTHSPLRDVQTPSTRHEPLEPGRERVSVRRLVPGWNGATTEPGSPTAPAAPTAQELDRALRSTPLLQVDAPELRQAAQEAAGHLNDPWEKANALCALVHREIDQKDLTVAFGSALQTWKTRQGDCTEHAVLLAALCRAQGIPSRLAAGLVGLGRHLGYHLWTEVYVGKRWVGLDGALGRAPTDARYLALAVSDLAEDSTGPLLYGIFDVLGTISVEVETAETLEP